MAALEGIDIGGFQVDLAEGPRIAYLLLLELLFFAYLFHHCNFFLPNVFLGVGQQ
jgi:hypothetical protein